MSTFLLLDNLTAQNLRGSRSWVLCQAQSGGWGGVSECVCVYARAHACVSMCVCVHMYMCEWLPVRCVHVCQDNGMDGCQGREQHHVRVLADDARFRYTNSNSQLSHETISSHDSPHSRPVCSMWFSTWRTVIPPSEWVQTSACLSPPFEKNTARITERKELMWVAHR